MYSRNYYTESGEKISIPENYDGVTFGVDMNQDDNPPIPESVIETGAEANKNPWEALPPPPPPPSHMHESSHGDKSDSILTGLTKSPVLGGLFGKGLPFGLSSLKFPKIGTEEILIIGAALFLFFSKDGDRETAIILLLLLLVN